MRRFRLAFASVLALAGCLTLSPGGVAAQPREMPVATDPRIEQAGDVVRLTMTLSSPVEVKARLVPGPDRVIVDLPSVNFQPPPSFRRTAGFVGNFRFGLFTADKARMVIDLTQPALVVRAETRAVRGGFGELVIELRRASRQEFQAAAAASDDAPAAIPAPQRPAGDSRPTIAIDPGHGGIDPGAVVASIAEKQVVLAFGQKLRDALQASGRYRVVMTRDDDRFVALGERVRLARAAGADLFISIHADSLTQASDVRGATIYTGSERATDAESARLAAKENQADAVAGLDAAEDVQDVAGILMDLAKRETRSFTSVFARNLVEKLGGSVKMHKVPLRSAGFRVLGAPDVPSVLIELGYMSSPKDAELMNSESWRGQAIGAVQAAIDSYFRQNRPASPSAGMSGQGG